MNLESPYNLIINNVSRFIDLTELEKRKYISLLTKLEVKKKEFLMKAGEITRYEYFVVQGCLKVYTLDLEGVPHISMFAIEDYWTVDLASFMTRETSKYYIKAIEDSEILAISRTNFDLLFKEFQNLKGFIAYYIRGH